MKPSRSALPAAPPAAAAGPARSWVHFWFTPVDPVGLHVLRLLAGLLFLAWLLPFAGHLDSLFGRDGWLDRQGYADLAAYAESAQLPEWLRPPVGWSVLYLVNANSTALTAFYWASVAVLALFTLGVAPRLTAVLAWVIVVSFTANPVLYYPEGDTFLKVLAFYLMIGCVLVGQRDRQRLPARLLGLAWPITRAVGRPSLGANLALRLLQVHFAIIIVTNGLHKLQFGDWWSGVALWYPLHPPFATTLAQAQAQAPHRESYLFVLSAAAYAMLVWQIGFPLFAWRRKLRVVLIGGALIGWLGLALIYQLPLLGPALLIGCLSFVTADEWHRVFGLLARRPGLRWLARWLPDERAEEPGIAGIRKDPAASPVPSEIRMAKSESIMSRTPGA
ncbi:MAG TPA: hypothetical protein VNK04_08760 [Gemmataceae bacterium]|nr:hypothetical protein [Gemmataceae bacterium]